MITRVNKSCAYFPCHERLEDCTFCYCSFYPCGDKLKGRYVITKNKRKIWSCQDCSWIHKKSVVDKIFRMIRNTDLSSCIRQSSVADATIQGKIEKTAVIILGHGSNLRKANNSLCKLVKEIKNESGLEIVEPAFLQLCRPDLKMAIEKVVKIGCKRVIIVPFFLFIGNHVTRDIPKIIEEAAKRYKDVKFVYTKNIGQDSRINNIVMDRIREASR